MIFGFGNNYWCTWTRLETRKTFKESAKYYDETPINYWVGETPKMDSLKIIFHEFETVLFATLPKDGHKITLLRNLRLRYERKRSLRFCHRQTPFYWKHCVFTVRLIFRANNVFNKTLDQMLSTLAILRFSQNQVREICMFSCFKFILLLSFFFFR